MKASRVDRFFSRIQNHPVLSVAIIVGTIVIGVSTFTGALKNLTATIGEWIGTPAPVDISGRWRDAPPDRNNETYFDFQAVDGRLYGTVWVPRTFFMPNGESGILDGRIIGHSVSFSTRHEYLTWQGSAHTSKERITRYEGQIAADAIRLRRIDDRGHASEVVARKIIDKTDVAANNTPAPADGGYRLAYALPGHEGGIRSLSFGPDGARFLSGGLSLASGGARDGQIKRWDAALAELYDAQGLPAIETGGSVHLAYAPEAREAGANLAAVGVSTDGHQVMIRSYYLQRWGAGASGGRLEPFSGAAERTAISGNGRILAVSRTEAASRHTIDLFDNAGHILHSIEVQGAVDAMALSSDGKRLALAQAGQPDAAVLKMLETSTGAEKWRASSPAAIAHLVFRPDDGAGAAGMQDGRIGIWDAADGSMLRTVSDSGDHEISCLAFSRSGTLLAAAASSSGMIRIWDPGSGRLVQEIENDAPAAALCFSHDARLLATGGGGNGVIQVWARPKRNADVPKAQGGLFHSFQQMVERMKK